MKNLKTLLFALALLVSGLAASAQLAPPLNWRERDNSKDYKASLFGIESNGSTLNTRSIQAAIDYIHKRGGGTLVFNVGHYLTGSIELKSNVTIHLMRGAVLLGSTNPWDYDTVHTAGWQALVKAVRADNVSITGEGIIDGQGREMSYRRVDLIQKGLIDGDNLGLDRPSIRPTLVYFRECTHAKVIGITLKNPAFWTQIYDQCVGMTVDRIFVDSKAFWNNDGIDIVDCKDFTLTNSFIDASDDAICLKSHEGHVRCENIEVRNCIARSSASGIKFGTVTVGGYKNIRIINNKVYDTHRSAITIATPDGGDCENILVDSLWGYNTGNAIYLRINNRRGAKVGKMNNITIRNMYCEIPAGKTDAGYDYEGPVQDLPRNVSPASIVGLAGGHDIENVTLQNIEIVYPGGGNPNYAYRGLKPAELDAIPEREKSYPEFSQFDELPAWGFWVRHAKNVTFDNVTFTAMERDYRPAVVLQEADGITLENMTYNEPGGRKKQVFTYKTKNVTIR